MEISIPGHPVLFIDNLVLDYNGTLARDGQIADGVRGTLIELASAVRIHILTADTFGTVASSVSDLPVELCVLPAGRQDRAKSRYVKSLGPDRCAAIGNGRNDSLMLKRAALGIGVIGPEGASSIALNMADITCLSITDALGLFLNPLRIVATLRT